MRCGRCGAMVGREMGGLPLTSAIAASLTAHGGDQVERGCVRCGVCVESCDACRGLFWLGDSIRCADGGHTCRRCASAAIRPIRPLRPIVPAATAGDRPPRSAGRARRLVIRHKRGKVIARIVPYRDGVIPAPELPEVPAPEDGEIEREQIEIDNEPIA